MGVGALLLFMLGPFVWFECFSKLTLLLKMYKGKYIFIIKIQVVAVLVPSDRFPLPSGPAPALAALKLRAQTLVVSGSQASRVRWKIH